MEIAVSQFHVTQGRHLKHEAVHIITGDGHAAFGRLRGFVRFDHIHFQKGVAAHGRAIVAGDAAAFLEELVACQFVGGKGFLVALQSFAEAGVGVTTVFSDSAMAVVTWSMSILSVPKTCLN